VFESVRASGSAELRLPRPGEWVGELQIERELGRGGMGAVFLARRAGAPVALKLMLGAGSEPGMRLRFEREAQAAASIPAHPGVVQIFSYGAAGAFPSIVTEYVEGSDLARLLKAGSVSDERALEILGELAEALDHVHEAGVVHRDLKPANVLIAEDGRALLTDFGLARRNDFESLTQSGELLGTPGYMAPEMMAGEHDKVGPAADLWALAVLAYELLTGGQRPFPGATMIAIGQAVLRGKPVPIQKYRPDFAEELFEVFEEAFRKDPEERDQTAVSFVRSLGAAMTGEAVARSRRRRRQRRVLGAVAVSVPLFALLLVAGSLLQRGSAERARIAGLRARIEAIKGTIGLHWAEHLIGQFLPKTAGSFAAEGCEPFKSLAANDRELTKQGSPLLQPEEPILRLVIRIEGGKGTLEAADQAVFEAASALRSGNREGFKTFLLRIPTQRRWRAPRLVLKALGERESGRSHLGLRLLRQLPGNTHGAKEMIGAFVLGAAVDELFDSKSRLAKIGNNLKTLGFDEFDAERTETLRAELKRALKSGEEGVIPRGRLLRGWRLLRKIWADPKLAGVPMVEAGPKLHGILAEEARMDQREDLVVYHEVMRNRLDSRLPLRSTKNVDLTGGSLMDVVGGAILLLRRKPVIERFRMSIVANRLGLQIAPLPIQEVIGLERKKVLSDAIDEEPWDPVLRWWRGRMPLVGGGGGATLDAIKRRLGDFKWALRQARLPAGVRPLVVCDYVKALLEYSARLPGRIGAKREEALGLLDEVEGAAVANPQRVFRLRFQVLFVERTEAERRAVLPALRRVAERHCQLVLKLESRGRQDLNFEISAEAYVNLAKVFDLEGRRAEALGVAIEGLRRRVSGSNLNLVGTLLAKHGVVSEKLREVLASARRQDLGEKGSSKALSSLSAMIERLDAATESE